MSNDSFCWKSFAAAGSTAKTTCENFGAKVPLPARPGNKINIFLSIYENTKVLLN